MEGTEEESYHVEILHFENPHLIWILRKDTGQVIFEQVGVYGLVPLEQMVLETGVISKRTETWMPAVGEIIKKFKSKGDIYFFPTLIDRRSSIFKRQVHKFGDMFYKHNGRRVYLSDFIFDHGYALHDQTQFQKMLFTCIKTKLSSVETYEALKVIEKHLKSTPHAGRTIKILQEETSIYQDIKDLSATLTKQNLEMHNRDIGDVSKVDIYTVIENKTRDLTWCKDEEFAIGRGCRRRRKSNSDQSDSTSVATEQSTNSLLRNKIQALANKRYIDMNSNNPASESQQRPNRVIIEEIDSVKKVEEKSKQEETSSEDLDFAARVTKPRKAKALPKLQPEEYLVAYGPPMEDKTQYKIKTVKNNEDATTGQNTGLGEGSNKQVDSENNLKVINSRRLSATTHVSDSSSQNVHDKAQRVRDKSQIDDCKDFESKDDGDFDDFWDENDSHNDFHTKNHGHDSIRAKNYSDDSFRAKNDSDDSFRAKTDIQDCYRAKKESHDSVRAKKDSYDDLRASKDRHDDYWDKRDRQGGDTDKKCDFRPKRDGNRDYLTNNSKQRVVVAKHDNVDVTQRVRSGRVVSLEVQVSNYERREHISPLLQKLKSSQSILNKTPKDNLANASTKEHLANKSLNKQIEPDPLDAEIEAIKKKLNVEYGITKKDEIKVSKSVNTLKEARNVNPYRNMDGSNSIFVDRLVAPIMMVHTKNNNLIVPLSDLRDICFKTNIRVMLKTMNITEPSRPQSVSWPYILKGHSIFMVSPTHNGKTFGYIPAVCNLAIDFNYEINSVGPIIVIICATTKSVFDVAQLCNAFLGGNVLACYQGSDMQTLTTSVLNGCDVLVTTPPMMYRLLIADLGVDLQRLSTVVLDDCERLSEIYLSEIKTLQYYVKETLKNRVDKKFKVQYIVSSRKWCDFMAPLAKSSPDTIIAISAFHECVLYSKTNTTVNFVLKEKKIDVVIDFLNDIDTSKRTVIVCRSDDEVNTLEKTLKRIHGAVFSCNNSMTIHDLRNINVAWSDYEEPIDGPILICCDGNLTHMNVTNANFLIHYSMPDLFSMFSKRFSVLNDNYASIFGPQRDDVKVKILLDEDNVEELPKILNFVKRCTSEVPASLEEISRKILERKDLAKAEQYVRLCDNLLTLSECPDYWNCTHRHAILKGFDEPKDWMPKNGVIIFNILHYDSAVCYSARLLSHITQTGSTKYPKNYSKLSLEMGMYYSKEVNQKSHGIPKVGDVCAVAVKQNFFARCQVLGLKKSRVLINLIDEERLQRVKEVDLYHLPEKFKSYETHVVKVRLANVKPQDKDVTFSELAKNLLKKVTDQDGQLFLRGHVVLAVANNIFVDTLEACQYLAVLNETVVKRNFRTDLLENHALPNPGHVEKLVKLCAIGKLVINKPEEVVKPVITKTQYRYTWAFLPSDELITVAVTNAESPSNFFVCLTKFRQIAEMLNSDIKKYINANPKSITSVDCGDIVLAQFPEDKVYERARIEEIFDDSTVECFFVDNGDRRTVSLDKLKEIPENFVERLPFQAIECRLVGVEPHGDQWTEFSLNWFSDTCFDDNSIAKQLYAKRFIKEEGTITGTSKYAIVLLDTNGNVDVNVNKSMLELNLAAEDDDSTYLDEPLVIEKVKDGNDSDNEEDIEQTNSLLPPIRDILTKPHENHGRPIKSNEDISSNHSYNYEDNVSKHVDDQPLTNHVFGKPLRSMPLVSDNIDIDECDVNFEPEFFRAMGLSQLAASLKPTTDVNTGESFVRSSKFPMISNGASNKMDDDFNDNFDHKNSVKNTKSDVTMKDLLDNDQLDSASVSENENFAHNISVDNIMNESQTEGVVKNNDTESLTKASEIDSDDLSVSDIFDKVDESKDLSEKRTDNINSLRIVNQVNSSPVLVEDDPNIVFETTNRTKISSKSNIFALQAFKKIHIKNNQLNQNGGSAKIDINAQNGGNDTKIDNNPKIENIASDSDVSSVSEKSYQKVPDITEQLKKPKVIWRQKKNSLTVKIQLIGVQEYALNIESRSLTFQCEHNDTDYGFQIELFGVIDKSKATHCNKGQYIQINLHKCLRNNWLNLSKDWRVNKWIVYDVDSIDTSSDEEEINKEEALNIVKENYEREDSDSDDFDFYDDVTCKPKYH